jgi:hypothetical protein
MPSMDYAGAREAFFQPRSADAPQAGSNEWDLPGRALRDAIEPIATIHYWSEPAYEEYAALGLDFLSGYVWSRSCVLGEPEGSVVAAAFGVFDPGAVAALYAAGRAACSLADIRAARERGARAALEATIPDSHGVAKVAAALRRGAEAIDITGRPLSAGLSALPWPDEERLQLWHASILLREYRGDCHVAACITAGIGGLEANIMTERRVGWTPLAYTGTRAWSPEAMEQATTRLTERALLAGDGLSEAGRQLRDKIEHVTERQVAPVLEAIGPALEEVVTRCTAWSKQILDRGWFPPDAYKRASG